MLTAPSVAGLMSENILQPKESGVYRYVSATEWVSGSNDGSVALWSQLKKKPVSLQKSAHCQATGASPGCVDGDAVAWVQSVATCPGGDLVVCFRSHRNLRLQEVLFE
jgi:ribosomal RNA-processing protein 9